MEKIQSADGTTIAFDQLGAGPPLILVSGAACDRRVDAPLAQALARRFTVLNYDRRGRGDSDDTPPYAVAREVADIAALVDAAGGTATVVGLSSGALLAAEAAARGVRVRRLVMWEPPVSTEPAGQRRFQAYAARLTEMLEAGRRADALVHFMDFVGMPEEAIAHTRQSPYWQVGLDMAHTLGYDAAVMGDGGIPADRFGRIGVPTLVLSGTASPDFLRDAAARTAEAIPGARHEELAGQDHNVSGAALTPVVARFAAERFPEEEM